MTLQELKSMPVHGNAAYDTPIFQALVDILLDDGISLIDKADALYYVDTVVMGLDVDRYTVAETEAVIAQTRELGG